MVTKDQVLTALAANLTGREFECWVKWLNLAKQMKGRIGK
jgi:hypothetical protein